jgi:hypothetical protein
VLVLVAVQASALLPTILSRCQRVSFGPLPMADVVALLTARGRSAVEARALATYANGSPGAALELDAEFFGKRRRELLGALAGMRGAGFKKLADFAQTLLAEDKDPQAVLALIASWQRDALRRAVLGADASCRTPTSPMRSVRPPWTRAFAISKRRMLRCAHFVRTPTAT